MLRQHISNDCNRSADPFCEFILAKAIVHLGDNALPEFVAAFFVNRFVANDSELTRARHHKNEHSIVLPRLVHPEPMKFPLRRNEGIILQLAALDQNADLTGGLGFRFANCFNDPAVVEVAEKFSRAHFCYQLDPAPPPPKLPPPPVNPLNPPPPPPPGDQPPLLGMNTGPPPRDE